MKKRLLSILLMCCMVLTMLPVTAAAEGESATAQGGDATFTLSASSASCADRHTGELGSIQVTGVDISRWKSDKKITLQYDVQYRCTDSSCELYSSDDSFFSYSGTHTFIDTNTEFCHKKISESFAATIPAALPSGGTKNFSISFALTSDKGIYESVFHEQNVDLCTEYYYNPRCWECTGCGYFFLNADMSGNKFTKDKVYFPPAGHDLKHVPAKDPTCVAKGTVEHWHCERCTRNFGDEQGTSELTTIETNAPLAAHQYGADGVCKVCSRKAAAGVQANAGMVWYDTMGEALTALTDGAQLAINADYTDTITLNQTCTVEVKAGVTAADIQIENAENCAVTIVNNGTISNLSGYTGKLVLKSGSGTYGNITNRSEGGTVGALLYRESATKFCYCRTTAGQWLRPEQATESIIKNVIVSYAPLATLTISGGNVTGGDGSYALTANKDDTVTLTAAASNMDGNSSTSAAYRWYYENDPDTALSTASTLTLETVSAGKRTIVCMATVDGYSITAKLVLTVGGQKDAQSFTLKIAKAAVGIREKVLPFLSVEGVQEEAAVTYYQMLGETPAPETDTAIDADFTFTTPGNYQLYAYTAETDNYAATASSPVAITVTPHADHCICGGTFNHTHKNVEWQAWDGKSEIAYEGEWIPISATGSLWYKVAYVYLTGDVTANLTISGRTILHLCLNGYSFTSADPSKPAITVAGTEKAYVAKLDLCDCADTGTLGGASVSGGSVHATWAEINLYGGTLTGNNATGNGGAVYLSNSSFTMHGGAISNNTASNGGGIYAGSRGETVNINGGIISGNRATKGGGIYASSGAKFHLNGGEIQNNVATEAGGGVYCSNLYSQNTGRCEFYGGTISGNTAQRGGGAYVRVCFIGYRNCRITGNTAAEAGGGLYLVPFASEKRIYMGNVYGSGGTIAPYIYDNTVNSAQNNLYLSDPDTQIQFTSHIDTNADIKLGVYFTGITSNGASVLLNYLQINSESRAKTYLDRIFCDNPEYGLLEIQQDGEYYNLYLRSTISAVKVTLDPNGGTLSAGEGSIFVQPDSPYGTLPTPTRDSYRFDGWFTEKDGGTKVEESTVMTSREAHTLYAHWTFLHEHCICGGDTAVGDHTAHTSQVFTAWNGTDAISYTNNTAYVYLSQNVTISSNLVVDGTTLYLCLSGNTFASNGTNKITVKNGGRLVLCDCAGGGTIKGATSGWGGTCVYLYQSTLDIFGGKITGGKVTGKGGGGAIALDDSKCVLNIYGGEISGNNGKNSGGAIFLNNKDKKGGTVNMYGGLIANNTATNGGVIYSACGGTFNLVGGTISGNKANNGGVVYATSGGVVNLTGGTITGNKATKGDGGVINMAGGTVTISGAKLTGNTSSQYGGAVYLYNGVTVTMTGGEISSNQAASEGGAVHVYGTSTFNLSGGKITGNSSVDGGAIYLNREPSVLNMSGGVISGNTATGNGGGVYIYRSGSICNLSGGTIENNTAGSGGGIYVNPSNSGQLKLSGAPTVRNNTVSGAANNVYLPSGKTLSIVNAMTDGARVGITTANKNYPVAFSNAYGSNYESSFSSDDADASAEYNTGDQKLYLVAKQYDITVEIEGNGAAFATPARAAANTEITLTATPTADSHFNGWQVVEPQNLTLDGNTFTMPKSTVTVKATFALHSFTAEVAEEQYLKSGATCTEQAEYYKSCTACGLSSEGTAEEATFFAGNILGHDWGAWTSNGNDTHTRVCFRDASHTETDNCSGGTADCKNRAICETCGGEYGEMNAHDFTAETAAEQYLKSAATCTEKAVYYKSCTVCGLSSEGTAEEATFFAGNILGHDWGAWTSNGNDTHTRVCFRDASHTETDNCSGGTADCKNRAICETCGGEYGEMNAHDFTAETAAEQYLKSAATCTEKAVYYKSCTVCGLSSKGTADEATFESGEPLDHDFGAWTSNGNDTHTRVCSRDASHTETDNCTGGTASCTMKAVCEVCKAEYGEKDPEHHAEGCELEWVVTETEHEQKYSLCGKVTIAKEKHTFGDWTITQRPTLNRDGEKERICQICQYKETKTIPATGSNYSYYTIKATAGAGGSISPSGNVSVREGRDQAFTITPDKGYAVANVKIDGRSIGAVKSYTFENVRRNHTIEVSFARANEFIDVPAGSYFYEAVMWAVENGVTTGISASRFDPDGICTRAQAVTFLWRAAGSPAPETSTMPFTDVPVGSYYYDAVLWAVENGITKGTSDTTFSPNMTCSRAQIVTFLWRSEKSPAAGSRNPFADVKSTAYYADAVLWAVREDITKGTTSTTFSPDADCTRAQIVTFLWRCKK